MALLNSSAVEVLLLAHLVYHTMVMGCFPCYLWTQLRFQVIYGDIGSLSWLYLGSFWSGVMLATWNNIDMHGFMFLLMDMPYISPLFLSVQFLLYLIYYYIST